MWPEFKKPNSRFLSTEQVITVVLLKLVFFSKSSGMKSPTQVLRPGGASGDLMHVNLIEAELSLKTGGENCMYCKEINTESGRNVAGMRREMSEDMNELREVSK